MQIGGQAVDHGEEDIVDRLLGVHDIQQIMHVRNAELGGEAWIDGAALGAFLIELLAGEIRVDDVLRLDPERSEVAGKDRRLGVHVQHARHADADVRTSLHQLGALFLRGRERVLRHWVGDDRGIRHAKHRFRGDLDKIRIGFLDAIQIPLDLTHVLHVLHCAFLAGGYDQPLGACLERHLGFHRGTILGIDQRGFDIDERAQALVLAEIAAGGFVARCFVGDLRDGVNANECGLPSVVPKAAGFESAAYSTGLAAMLVHDYVGRHVLALET